MSVQTQIDRISEAVQSALAALTEKGVTVPDGTKVDGLAALIANIEDGSTLTVTAPALCTVTVSKDGKTKTKVAGTDGVVVFKGLSSGDWLLSITDGTQTAQKTVTITADYTAAITFFAATIHVTYPAGSTCTATDGVTTLTAPDTSGTWDCVVPNAGTWTITVVEKGWSETADISENGQETSVDVSKYWLYKDGNEYTDRTGGWVDGSAKGFIEKTDTYIYIYGKTNQSEGYVWTTNALSKIGSTICAELQGSNSSQTRFGIMSKKAQGKFISTVNATTTDKVTVSLSLDGITSDFYVGVNARSTNKIYIYKVWME